jgi:hypothetical protein
MAELAVACPGTTPAQWWAAEPDDVLTVLEVLEDRR